MIASSRRALPEVADDKPLCKWRCRRLTKQARKTSRLFIGVCDAQLVQAGWRSRYLKRRALAPSVSLNQCPSVRDQHFNVPPARRHSVSNMPVSATGPAAASSGDYVRCLEE
jgi:hypothetical protein